MTIIFSPRTNDNYSNVTRNSMSNKIFTSVNDVVIVRTGAKNDSHGMSAFIIEKGTEGFKSGKKENKLGMRASETAELIFDNCRVHKDQMMGKEGDGFVQAMKVLDGGRISIAALSCGIARGAFECSVKYAKEREQFGKPISSFQAIAFKLADMATELDAAELLTFKAADLKNRGQKMTKEGAFAKYYASEVCVRNANEAVQIFGGYGFTIAVIFFSRKIFSKSVTTKNLNGFIRVSNTYFRCVVLSKSTFFSHFLSAIF